MSQIDVVCERHIWSDMPDHWARWTVPHKLFLETRQRHRTTYLLRLQTHGLNADFDSLGGGQKNSRFPQKASPDAKRLPALVKEKIGINGFPLCALAALRNLFFSQVNDS
ncbi:hypothetical protein SV7mr_37810 [Stieleria bergensis]|uniref:Uncharacterized protein n=1 Tax=Stieleria bergensis TaxID=2528025 RepID=A0A517SYM1_9BACT|nr:hypothetical protein SV7mr_37810 [Planctomycetes bacterium SV_7m_r]